VGDRDQDIARLPVQLEQQRGDGLGRLRVEVSGRLVAQEQGGLADERPGDGGALALSAAELRRAMAEPVGESDALQQGAGAILERGARLRVGQRRDQDVLQHRVLRQEMMVLEDESDRSIAEPGELRLRQRARVLTADPHRPGGRPVEGPDQVQERALAGAGGAGDGQRFTRGERQRDAVQDLDAVRAHLEALVDINQLERDGSFVGHASYSGASSILAASDSGIGIDS
jgi:hypothetical protein